MVFFNYSTMQMAAKVVYYGPGLCGKTTNLQFIYGHTSNDSRGEMVSLETETDRTLFFDLLPIDVGTIAGFSTRIQLYTVPGQVFYNTTRKLVLKGVDGVVFVADSQKPMLQANAESFKNLEENLAEMGLSIDSIPLVLQFNKRDLPSICTIEEMNQALNRHGSPWFEASAINGTGVFETLKGISKLTLVALKKKLARGNETPEPLTNTGSQPALTPAAPAPIPQATTPQATAPAASPAPTGPPEPLSDAGSAARPLSVPEAAPAHPLAEIVDAATAPPSPRPSRKRSKQDFDIQGELEKLRKGVRKKPKSSRAGRSGANGHGEMSREIQLTLKRDDFKRLRRFSLNVQVEDEDHQVVDSIRNFHVDIDDPKSLEKVLLKLSIALNAKG